jgi:hypothetical protein
MELNTSTSKSVERLGFYTLEKAEERWIDAFEGKYAVSTAGEFISYASGQRYLPKTTVLNNVKYVRVFVEDEVKRWRVGDLVAQAFLGSLNYVYKDGDRTNTALANLMLRDDTLLADEVWIEGYEQEYSIRRSGEIMTFKRNVRAPLKLSSSTVASKRVTLVRGSGRETRYVDRMVGNYF